MQTVSLKLSDGLARRLAQTARKRGISKSDLVRTAIENHLDRDNTAQHGSCLEAAGDLIGSVGGLADLSTNKRYLEGFGK